MIRLFIVKQHRPPFCRTTPVLPCLRVRKPRCRPNVPYSRVSSQVKVTGGGNKQPAAADLVKIPGVYDNVQFPDIWADNFHSFTVPGPPPAFGNNGGTVNAGSPPAVTPSAVTSSHAAPTSSSSHVTTASSPVTAPSKPIVSAQPSASSTLVSASPTSTGRCRSRSVRRQLNTNAKRMVKHHARAKRHH